MNANPPRVLVELVRVKQGRLEFVAAHAARLAASSALLGPHVDAAAIEREIVAAFEARTPFDGAIVASLAPGALTVSIDAHLGGGRDAESLASGLALTTRTGAEPIALEQGIRPKWERAEAAAAGDAIGVRDDGTVLGGERASLFLVVDDELVTPSFESGAFPGILRAAVLHAAEGLSIAAQERSVGLDDVARASDAFLASCAEGIVAVRSIDGRALPPPPPRSLWRRRIPQLRLRVHELGRGRFAPPPG